MGKRRILALLGVSWLWFGQLALSSVTLAATTPNQGINLQISPLPISLDTGPATTTGTDLRVRNGAAQTETLKVHVLKVSEDDNGNVHLSEPKSTDQWVNWISFSRTVFEAPPNDWQTIHMSINVPDSAAFGYYFAVEYERATAELPQPGHEVAKGAVATFVLLNVNVPGARREAQIVSFAADHKLYEYLPASFSVKARSTGNVHVAPHGNVFINKAGKQVGSVDINPAEGNILPTSSRFINTSWRDGFLHYELKTVTNQPDVDKAGRPIKSLKWDFAKVNQLRFGRYTAHLLMVYDNGQRDVPLEAYVSFWVIPWKILGGLLLIVSLVLIGVWASLRRLGQTARQRRKRRRDEK